MTSAVTRGHPHEHLPSTTPPTPVPPARSRLASQPSWRRVGRSARGGGIPRGRAPRRAAGPRHAEPWPGRCKRGPATPRSSRRLRIGEGSRTRPSPTTSRASLTLQRRVSREPGPCPRGAIVKRGDRRRRRTRTISVNIGRTPVTIATQGYALKFALPNFFFHVTTAYDLLRGTRRAARQDGLHRRARRRARIARRELAPREEVVLGLFRKMLPGLALLQRPSKMSRLWIANPGGSSVRVPSWRTSTSIRLSSSRR